MRLWICLALLPLALCTGCSNQEQAKQKLIERLQAGLADVRQAQAQRQQAMAELYSSRRRVLENAFDQDVRQRPTLTAEWVIESRKIYTTALEAMWQQEQASLQAHERMQQNLLVIEDGLKQLSWMSQLRENWSKAIETEVTRDKN